MRMSTLLEQVKGFSLDEGYSPKEIKMAIDVIKKFHNKIKNVINVNEIVKIICLKFDPAHKDKCCQHHQPERDAVNA